MKRVLGVFAVAVAMVLVSCGSADFTQVKEGMSKEEVVKLVGEPTMEMTIMGQTTLTYSSHTVSMKDGKVTSIEAN